MSDPLGHIRVDDPDPTYLTPLPGEPGDPPGDDPCDAYLGGWLCTRQTRHMGQHIAGGGEGGVIATWFDDGAEPTTSQGLTPVPHGRS